MATPESRFPEQKSDATAATPASDWSVEKASQHFNVAGWGAGYFSVSEKGHLVVHPHGQPGPTIDIMDVVEDIQERKLGFPCVVRFQDVLRDRVKAINEAFAKGVVEQLSELPQLLRLGEVMGVEPLIGLRSKLTTKGTGKWESSGGDFSKFGLTIPELIH